MGRKMNTREREKERNLGQRSFHLLLFSKEGGRREKNLLKWISQLCKQVGKSLSFIRSYVLSTIAPNGGSSFLKKEEEKRHCCLKERP